MHWILLGAWNPKCELRQHAEKPIRSFTPHLIFAGMVEQTY